MANFRNIFLVALFNIADIFAKSKSGDGPVFLHEPPAQLHFSNSSGAMLPCSAHGSPPPVISWLTLSGKEVTDIPGIRKTFTNGSLQLLPFAPSAYTGSVHATGYVCRASSSEGAIVSRPVRVRAIVRQFYEVQVYDEFVISGNTAVLKCHVPSFIRDYIAVTSWIRGSGERIESDVLSGGRYSVFRSGELHIRHVTKTDEFQSYQCETRHILSDETSVSAVAGRLMVNDPRSSVPPRITDSKSSVQAHVSSTVELPCAAQGYPIPQYKWYRIANGEANEESRTIDIQKNDRVKQVGGSLVIQNARVFDAGKYVCIVSSSVGEERTYTQLEVSAPLSAHISPQIEMVDVGSLAMFNCSAEGFPIDDIRWLKDGKSIVFGPRIRLIPSRTLVIKDVNRLDKGMYQCVISNQEDSAQGSSQLKLGDATPQWVNTTDSLVVSPGEKVVLHCIIQGSPPPDLLWTLRGRLINSRKKSRIYIEQEVKRDIVISKLHINAVSVDDGGVWSCVGRNRAGQINYKGKLNVRGPPYIRPMIPERVVAGKIATFDCIVVGYPIDTIYWEKNGVVLPVSPRQTVYSNGTLEIRNVNRESDGGKYSCIASAGKDTVRSQLSVSVQVPPIIDKRLFSWGAGYPMGSPARIMCVTMNGDLPIRFRWFHNGKLLEPRNSLSIRYLDDQTSILLFNSLEEKDAGKYTCVASNSVSNDSFSANLVVKVAPSWTKAPQDTSVVVGSNLVLPCQAFGSPTPNATWRMALGGVPRQYVPVSTLGSNVRILEEDQSLYIENIQRHQGGEMLCVVSNDVGSDLSKSVKIVVKVPPQFKYKSENVTVTAGKQAELSCYAYGNLPIKILWLKGNPAIKISSSGKGQKFEVYTEIRKGKNLGKSLPLRIREEHGDGIVSKMTVTTTSRYDSEIFSCLASNIYGNDTKKIHLIVQELPGIPSSPKISNTGSRSVNLTWDPPIHDGNSEILIYRVLIINSTDSWANVGNIRTIEVPSTTVTVDSLSPAHAYLVRIIAANSIGASPPSREKRIITIHEPPTEGPSNLRIVPLSSTSLKATWAMHDTSLSQLASYGYYIGYRLANSTDAFRYETIEPATISIHRPEAVLQGLQKNNKYIIAIQAYNEAGAGPRSAAAIAKTDEDVPSEPPSGIQCSSLSSNTLLLKWKPPRKSSVNGILRGYKIMYGPTLSRSYYVTEDIRTQTVLTLSTTLLSLTSYTNYSVTISAQTRVGDGVRSDPIFCLTGEDVPQEITHLKALSVDRSTILVSWLPPEHPNGIITKYSVLVSTLENISAWQDSSSLPSPATHSVVDAALLNGFRHGRNDIQDKFLNGQTWVVQGTESHFFASDLNERVLYSFSVRASTRVGQGGIGARVTQRPRHDAAASISSFTQEIIAIWGEELRLPCKVVGRPTPTRVWMFNGKKIGLFAKNIQEFPDGSLLLKEIRGTHAGNYTCSTTNHHGNDAITYAINVQASKEGGVPPMTPLVYVSDVTSASITLQWQSPSPGRTPIIGYNLHIKSEYGDWKKIDISGDLDSYSISSLNCGSRYQIYLTAFNHIGPSQKSDTLATKTIGKEPVVPSRSKFIFENFTSVMLRLAAWSDGGCPITSYAIEYQKDSSNTWRLVTNYAKWNNKSEYVIRGLVPNTSYLLRITANNAAGTSVATYPFITSSNQNDNLLTEQRLRGSPWLIDGPILIAIIISILLVSGAIGIAVVFSRKQSTSSGDGTKDTSLSVELNGKTLIRRQSLNIMEPFMSGPPSISDDIICSTFKLESPPPPPISSPMLSYEDESIYRHQIGREYSFSEEKDDFRGSSGCIEYEC